MIRKVAKVDHYKKSEHLLNEDEVCDKAGLLVKGLVDSIISMNERYYFETNGRWNNYHSSISCYSQKPGNKFIEAIEKRLEDAIFEN